MELSEKKAPNIGIATIYRNIKSMVEQGEVIVVNVPGHAPYYSLPQDADYPIFCCTRTSRVYYLDRACVKIKLGDLPKEIGRAHV